jgi:hypothetical protein
MLIVGVVNLGIFGYILVSRSTEGKNARTTQCAREPVFRKIMVAGVKYRLLTREDLREFDRNAPTGCPPPKIP